MAVPKQRNTSSKRNRRRSHISLTPPILSICPHCKKEVLPHTLCRNCGYYKGVEVVNVLDKLEKKERKAREKEIKATEKQDQSKQKPMTMEELSKKKF